jgi:hypothetical protein
MTLVLPKGAATGLVPAMVCRDAGTSRVFISNPTGLAIQKPDEPMTVWQQHQGRKAASDRKRQNSTDAKRYEKRVVKHGPSLILKHLGLVHHEKGAKS